MTTGAAHEWPCPAAGGETREHAFGFLRGRGPAVLVIAPLFDEMNRLRRTLTLAIRALDAAGIDAVMPDLPGCNESLAPFAAQSIEGWRSATAAAAAQFGATRVLAVRGGALVAPEGMAGIAFEPVSGASLLKGLLRARSLAAREAGRDEPAAALLEAGRRDGLELAGYPCGAPLVAGLDAAVPSPALQPLKLAELGTGSALWLRAEPGEDAAMAGALARRVAEFVP